MRPLFGAGGSTTTAAEDGPGPFRHGELPAGAKAHHQRGEEAEGEEEGEECNKAEDDAKLTERERPRQKQMGEVCVRVVRSQEVVGKSAVTYFLSVTVGHHRLSIVTVVSLTALPSRSPAIPWREPMNCNEACL